MEKCVWNVEQRHGYPPERTLASASFATPSLFLSLTPPNFSIIGSHIRLTAFAEAREAVLRTTLVLEHAIITSKYSLYLKPSGTRHI